MSRYRADVDDGPFGSDEEWCKILGHAQRTPEIDVKHFSCLLNINIQGRHKKAASRIVHKVVQCTTSMRVDSLDGGKDVGGDGDVQSDQGDVGEFFEIRHLR